jgi:2-polyprenyl-3-methyl-5-hydroxy-6-metoxy-1,4-benzoquinol methylase
MQDQRNPKAVDYFHRKIHSFDDIYRDDKPGLMSILNRTLRASVRIRFDLAFEMFGDLTGKSVLDIGCGSGRYVFEAVRRGASRILGIDAAAGAIDMAAMTASELGVGDRVEFSQTNFLDFAATQKFDIVLAVGYFDYIFDPVTHLKRMIELSDGIVYASFPKRWSVLSGIRKIRLTLNRCPVRFYTKKNIRDILSKCSVERYELKTIFRDNILILAK